MTKLPSKTFKRWWTKASKDDRDRLAKLAKTSANQLGQIAGEHRPCNAALARRIEIATVKIAETNEELPVVRRSELNTACSVCEYAKLCKQ